MVAVAEVESRKGVGSRFPNIPVARGIQPNILFLRWKYGVLVHIALAVMLAITLNGKLPRFWLSAWIVTLVALLFGLAWLARCHRQATPMPSTEFPYAQAYLIGISLSGVIWGLAGWEYAGRGAAREELILGLTLFAAGASMLRGLAGYPTAFLLFLCACTLPFTIRVFISGGEGGYALTSILLLSTWVLVGVSRHHGQALRSALLTEAENVHLRSELKGASERASAVGEILQQQIAGRLRAERSLSEARSRGEERARERADELERTNHRLKERIGYFRQVMGAVGDAIIATDADGRVSYMNSAAEGLTGWSSHDALGLQVERILNLTDSNGSRVPSGLAQVSSRRAKTQESQVCVLSRRSGSRSRVSISSPHIQGLEGDVIGRVFVMRQLVIPEASPLDAAVPVSVSVDT